MGCDFHETKSRVARRRRVPRVSLPAMHRLVTVFLCAFLVDGVLSVSVDWQPVSLVQPVVALAVFGFALVLYAIMAFDRRLPKRLLLPLILFLIWASICGGFPLAFLEVPHVHVVISWMQLALGLLLFGIHLKRPPISDATPSPAFTWRNFALTLVATMVLVPLTLVTGAVNAIGVALETTTDGYLKIRPKGLLLEEREFQKGNKRVRLVSMMHIGNREFYESVRDSFSLQLPAVVLMEGVRDDRGTFDGDFSYAPLAEKLGLQAQEADILMKPPAKQEPTGDVTQPDFRHSDVDVSSFHPRTLEMMRAIGHFLANPTLETALQTFGAEDSPFQGADVEDIVMTDILTNRNAHLANEIRSALDDYDVVIVPWGALHMPEIEDTLESWGFQKTREIDRPVVKFGKSAKR